MPVLAEITMKITAAGSQGQDLLSGVIAIEGFLFYWIQREAGGLIVYETVEGTVYILPDSARALAGGRDQAFTRAEMAMDPFAVDLFVIQGFFHLKKVLRSFMNCPTSLNCL
jgi:hypothetical protein